MVRNSKPSIFVSFSTKDMVVCENLIKNLNSPHYNFWYQKEINVGQEYKEIIKQNINSSVASILLLSNNFLTSEFINSQELPWIYQKDERSMIYEVFPIQIEKCNWENIDYLKHKQVFPSRSTSLNLNTKDHTATISEQILNYFRNAGYIQKKGWFR
jgi:hypothetical protein